MKRLLDEKGRLWGKINLIDLMVVLVIFCFLPMAYYGYKFYMLKQKVSYNGEFRIIKKYTLLMKVEFVYIMPELAELIREGDTDIAIEGLKVVSILINEPAKRFATDIEIGNEFADRPWRYLLILFDVPVYEKSGYATPLKFNNKPAVIGRDIKFTTDKYFLGSGKIVEIMPHD